MRTVSTTFQNCKCLRKKSVSINEESNTIHEMDRTDVNRIDPFLINKIRFRNQIKNFEKKFIQTVYYRDHVICSINSLYDKNKM